MYALIETKNLALQIKKYILLGLYYYKYPTIHLIGGSVSPNFMTVILISGASFEIVINLVGRDACNIHVRRVR